MRISLSTLKRFVYTFLISVSLFATDVFAQTQLEREKIISAYDLSNLKSLQERLSAKEKSDQQIAHEYAKKHKIPIVIEYNDGNVGFLYRITEDKKPIYYTTENVGAAITTRANTLNTGGRLGLNLNGQGMQAAIWDGGLLLLSHEAFGDRATQGDSPGVGCSDHANHVAGTIAAGFEVGPDGEAQGMAYEAEITGYFLDNPLSELPGEIANGLLLSNHSYGPGIFNNAGTQVIQEHEFGKYNSAARAWDELLYHSPYHQAVISAANDQQIAVNLYGSGYDILKGFKMSKNAIIVAAVREVLDYQGPESVEMSNFSSWGPTDDGRVKPDISAKGVSVLSAFCSGGYGFLSGTSMAAPNVTGTLLLLQQHYNEIHGEFMYASMLRGLAIHTADETGDADGPDFRFGWGLLNAEKAAQLITENGSKARLESHVLENDATYTTEVTVDGTAPLEVTICWTDLPGETVTSTEVDLFEISLINDLDIRVTKDGETYYPWKLDPANVTAAATKGDNLVDNVEKVSIKNPEPGTYTITVSHKGTLVNGNQRFALVLTSSPSAIASFEFEKSDMGCPTTGVEVNFINNSKALFANPDEGIIYHWTFEGGEPASSNEKNPTVNYVGTGSFDVTLITEASGDRDTLLLEDAVKITSSVPVTKSIDRTIPDGWNYQEGWEFSNVGIDQMHGSIWVNNFDQTYGEIDLSTLFYEVTAYDSLRISFDIAYTYFSFQVTDSLRISLQDCNGTNAIWQKGGFDLATVTPKTSLFTPVSNADWDHYTIETSVKNSDFAKLIFTNIGGNANAMYIDNIHIEGYSPALIVDLGDDVTACSSTTLDAGVADADSYSWNEVGNSTVLGTTQTLDVTASGTYEVTVSKFGKTETDQVTVTINNPATASFTYSLSDDLLTATFTNSSMNATNGYEWNFGDGNSSTAEAPTHTYAAYGSYTVTLTAKADCGDDTQSTFLTEVTSLDVDGLLSQQMLVYPNPNSGSFILDVPNVNVNKAQIQVLDITGRKIWEQHVNNLSKQNIQLHNIEAGVYFIRLEVDGKVGIRKVQVN
ncbi:MAG: S8 family serine peptidase [Flammeovirgaceae bacterium]